MIVQKEFAPVTIKLEDRKDYDLLINLLEQFMFMRMNRFSGAFSFKDRPVVEVDEFADYLLKRLK